MGEILKMGAVRPLSFDSKIIQHNASKEDSSCLDNILPRNPVTHKREFRIIPESFERALGNALYPTMINSQGGHYNKKNYEETVTKIGKTLIPICDRPKLDWQFSVIDSNQLNAWCLPNGKIAFYRGIIERMDQEKSDLGVGQFTLEQKIAAVMGHEMTHACARHSAKSLEFGGLLFIISKVLHCALYIFIAKTENEIQKNPRDPETQKKRSTATLAKVVHEIFKRVDGLILQLMVSHGSRKRELEADRYGMVYLHRAGYDPKAAIWLQRFFAKEHPKADNCFGKILGLFRSHPYSEDRVKANEETLKLIQEGKLK